jgi:hypothetical protein
MGHSMGGGGVERHNAAPLAHRVPLAERRTAAAPHLQYPRRGAASGTPTSPLLSAERTNPRSTHLSHRTHPPRLSSRPPCTRGRSSRRLHGQRKRNKRTRRQFPTPCAAKEKEKSLKAAESGRRSRPCSTVLSKTASAMRVETEASMEGSGFSVGKERTAGIGWRFEEWPIATAPEMEGI